MGSYTGLVGAGFALDFQDLPGSFCVRSCISIPREHEISGLEMRLMQQHHHTNCYRKFCGNAERETAILTILQTGDRGSASQSNSEELKVAVGVCSKVRICLHMPCVSTPMAKPSDK